MIYNNTEIEQYKKALINKFEKQLENYNSNLSENKSNYIEAYKEMGWTEVQAVYYLTICKKHQIIEYQKIINIVKRIDYEKISNLKYMMEINSDNFMGINENKKLENELCCLKYSLFTLDDLEFFEKTKKTYPEIKKQQQSLINKIEEKQEPYEIKEVRFANSKDEISKILAHNLKGVFKNDKSLSTFVKSLIDVERLNKINSITILHSEIKNHLKQFPKIQIIDI